MEKCLVRRTLFGEYSARFAYWLNAFIARAATLLPIDGSAARGTEQEAVNEEAAHILDAYGNKILRLAYSYLHNRSDAEDVLQDTLIKLLKTAPSFESEAHKLAWLLRVAANLSKNRIQYNSIRQADDVDELSETLSAEHKEDLSFVWEAVKALPEKYREVVHLFYYEGCSTAQIASILMRKEATVRSDLRRGRMALKETLKEEYDFEE